MFDFSNVRVDLHPDEMALLVFVPATKGMSKCPGLFGCPGLYRYECIDN
jgi:hypothetical protein